MTWPGPPGPGGTGGRAGYAPKTLITLEIGHYAVFRDSEGNHVELYSLH